MLIQIILIGLALCSLNLFLKKQSSEFVLPLELIFLVITSAILIDYLKNSFSVLSDIVKQFQYGEDIFASLVKGTSVCLISKFFSDICNESGNKLIADIVEFSGRVMLFVIAVPYIELIINIAMAFVK